MLMGDASASNFSRRNCASSVANSASISCAALRFSDDFLSITAQEIVDGFHANSYRTRWLVLVEIFDTEIGCARLLDNSLDDSVDRSIVAAFEAGNLKRDQIRMPTCELCSPYFVVRTAVSTRWRFPGLLQGFAGGKNHVCPFDPRASRNLHRRGPFDARAHLRVSL